MALFIPFAHAGHWLPDLAIFGAPVVFAALAIRWADRRERRASDSN